MSTLFVQGAEPVLRDREVQRLIDEFRRLPGVGQKSAQRLAFHVLRTSREDAARGEEDAGTRGRGDAETRRA